MNNTPRRQNSEAMTDHHVEISQRFILHTDDELESSDLLQASEKAWGAVAHRLKAIAFRRGWRQGSHRDYNTMINRLAEEAEHPEDFRDDFAAADGLHANFYNDFKEESVVRSDVERVKNLLSTLDEIESSVG